MSAPRRATALPLALFAVLAILTVIASVTLHDSVNDQEHRLLHERAGEVGALLTSSIGSVGSSLQIVGSVYETTRSATDFEASARPLAARGIGAVAVVQADPRGFVVRAAVGQSLKRNDVLDPAQAALARRAGTAGGPVSTVIVGASASARVLAFADALPGGIVVYNESFIGPARPIASTPNSPFNELQGVVYAGSTANPDQILLTTTAHPPTGANVDRRTITVGADKWLLVTASRQPLVGSLSRDVPWIVLVLGLFGSLIVAAVITLMLRRRAYALALVAERTADLQQTLLELEAARTAAETANHSKSEFLSRMSHELRTPLNAVLGFAQLLEIADLDADQHESVNQIVKGGRHLLDLINEVLDIARIETGNLALSAEPVMPSDVVSDVIDLVRPLAVERSISITTNLGPSSRMYVQADRQRLRQVLLNLLSNAVKYNRIGGTITVGCDQRGAERLRITVTDTGPGIATDLHDKLFEPFERLGAEQTNIEGTGVGLALSRRLADAMGGTLDFETTVGRGSTFWIELPVVEGPVERLSRLNPMSDEAVVESAPSHTVLYIEDNLANVKLIERLFAPRGDINLVAAMQGRLGLDLARRDAPDLVLLDLHLPDIEGREVLRTLRADSATAALPIIVLSADATQRQIDRLLADGANAYVTKPIDVAEFLRTIDEYLPAPKPAPAPESSSI